MPTLDTLPVAKIKYITFGEYVSTCVFLRENSFCNSIHNLRKFWQIYKVCMLFIHRVSSYFGVWQMGQSSLSTYTYFHLKRLDFQWVFFTRRLNFQTDNYSLHRFTISRKYAISQALLALRHNTAILHNSNIS